MAGFASPMPLYQTLPPFNLCRCPRGRPRHHPIMACLLFKVITTAAGHHSLWTCRRYLLKCPRLLVGRPCQWPALHRTSQPNRVFYGKQLLRKLFFQPGSSLLRPDCCIRLSIYLFYFFFLPFFVFSQNGRYAAHCSPAHPHVLWSVFCLWLVASSLYSSAMYPFLPRMAYYLPARLTRLIKFISCGAFLLGTLHPLALQSCNVILGRNNEHR
jgi:hypothetical protein